MRTVGPGLSYERDCYGRLALLTRLDLLRQTRVGDRFVLGESLTSLAAPRNARLSGINSSTKRHPGALFVFVSYVIENLGNAPAAVVGAGLKLVVPEQGLLGSKTVEVALHVPFSRLTATRGQPAAEMLRAVLAGGKRSNPGPWIVGIGRPWWLTRLSTTLGLSLPNGWKSGPRESSGKLRKAKRPCRFRAGPSFFAPRKKPCANSFSVFL